jgi:hypothetical protein
VTKFSPLRCSEARRRVAVNVLRGVVVPQLLAADASPAGVPRQREADRADTGRVGDRDNTSVTASDSVVVGG